MLNDQKRVVVNLLSEQFGCSECYFKIHIQRKPLKVVKEYSSMVTVEDENGERWNVFNGNFTISTGL